MNHTLFKRYGSLIDINSFKEYNKELYYIYNVVKQLHESFPDTNMSVDEIRTAFDIQYPDAKKEIYDALFNSIRSVEIAEDIGDSLLAKVQANQQALKLSEKAYEFTQGRATLEEIQALTAAINGAAEAKSDLEPEDVDLDRLLSVALKEEGLRWRLDFLNKSLGSLRPGDFGFMFKRPESGGTAFLASEVSYMLPQTERNIVWLNNEEANEKVMLRIYMAYFGITLGELVGDSAGYKKRFYAEVGTRLRFYGVDRSNKRDIQRIVERDNPVLVVYDQLDKVLGFDSDRDDLRLGAIYEWARTLTKKGHSAIGMTQADGNAEGVKWLTMAHVSNAKTAKQAEGDFIIGMGRSHDQETENIRYITVCKNKLLGSHDSIERMRHGRQEVLIQPEIMRFRDLMKYE